VTPLKLPRAIDLVIGTDITESKRSAKAARRKAVAGVAGRLRRAILEVLEQDEKMLDMGTYR
jgi:hypothetical protein